MKYLLDTNTCIRFLNGRAPKVLQKLTATDDCDIAVCSVVKAEMFAGSEKSRDPQRSRNVQNVFFSRYRSLPFNDEAADKYGKIRAHLEKQGTTRFGCGDRSKSIACTRTCPASAPIRCADCTRLWPWRRAAPRAP